MTLSPGIAFRRCIRCQKSSVSFTFQRNWNSVSRVLLPATHTWIAANIPFVHKHFLQMIHDFCLSLKMLKQRYVFKTGENRKLHIYVVCLHRFFTNLLSLWGSIGQEHVPMTLFCFCFQVNVKTNVFNCVRNIVTWLAAYCQKSIEDWSEYTMGFLTAYRSSWSQNNEINLDRMRLVNKIIAKIEIWTKTLPTWKPSTKPP